MANYSFVSGAQFRPFSYAEMIAPVQQATQEYNTIQEGIGDISSKAAMFDKLTNNKYKQYSDDLSVMAEELSKNGLKPSSRQGLLDMRKRYSSEIAPLETAYTRKMQLGEEMRKAQMQDNSLELERPVSTYSLEELIADPSSAPRSFSGAQLAKQVAIGAQHLAKEIANDPVKAQQILGGQYFELRRDGRFNADSILKVIQNDPNASEILKKIVDDAVTVSGVRDWKNPTALEKAYTAGYSGLWGAIKEPDIKQMSDKAYDYAMRADLAKAKSTKGNEDEDSVISPNLVPLYNARKLSEEENNYKKRVNDYSGYFYKDKGQWKMSAAGWKAYEEQGFRPTYESAIGAPNSENSKWDKPEFVPASAHSDFRKFMDEIGAGEVIRKGYSEANKPIIGDLWKNYSEESPESKMAKYDATKMNQYSIPIDETQTDLQKRSIAYAGKGKIKIVELDEEGKFKEIETIDAEDFLKPEYIVITNLMSTHGATTQVLHKNKVLTVLREKGVNPIAENNRDNALKEAAEWDNIVNSGYITSADGTTRVATPEEIVLAENESEKAVTKAHEFDAQLLIQNRTEPIKNKPMTYGR